MSILHLNQIKSQIEKLFSGRINLSDVINEKTPVDQKESLFLSRALAAYALHYLSRASLDVAAAAVTDGSDDNGLDAIHYDEIERRLYLVQSKWIHSGTGEPDNGEIKKFVSGVRDLFNLDFSRFNAKINAKKNIIVKALNDPNTRYEIVPAYTGINSLAQPSARDLNDLADEMNDPTELVSITPLNQADLYKSLTAGLAGEPIDLEIGIKGWGRVESPNPAYYGQVDGMQIGQWWEKYRGRLFARNLRGVLGDTDVNDEIRSTIETSPSSFWYFNNGITLVCKKISKSMVGGADTGFGTFHCQDVSVVNGAQTVSTIGKHTSASEENVKKLFVPLRVISLEQANEKFGEDVTKTNNRQNRIENRDFVSLDPEQTRIRTELAVDGIDYNLMRTESFTRAEKAFDLVESTTALACASGDVALVVQLKREIGKLWENIDKAPYKQLFNPQINGLYLWRCIQIQRKIDKLLEAIISETSSKSGRDYGVAVHGNRLIAALVFDFLSVNKFSDPKFAFSEVDTVENLIPHVDYSYQGLVAGVSVYYANAILPTLFKNATKCKNLEEFVKGEHTI
ncbi:MAG TPA: AIPR family protein [Terriglobales bacterium]|jgi:hypothetical protein|nr:AIPR family protein [Terriglobales bacterium]